MSSYFDKSGDWVFDRGTGQYTYTRTGNHNPSIIRESYFFSNQQELDNEEYYYYEEQKEKQKSKSSQKSN
jgi:hypothetical protein